MSSEQMPDGGPMPAGGPEAVGEPELAGEPELVGEPVLGGGPERVAASGARPEQEPVVVRAHRDAVAVAHAPERFSNAVSRFRQIPNGLDGHEHEEARRLLAPFFVPASLDALEPLLAGIAAGLVDELGEDFDAVGALGQRYAVRAQSAWLGWEPDLENQLYHWVSRHRAAARSGDAQAHGAVAAEFEVIVRDLIDRRRRMPRCDLTSLLMGVRWDDGRRFTDDEVISVLRNWTGGDLASLALCVGVVVRWLADHPALLDHVRGASDAALDAIIDEILRLDDPFVSSRRIVTTPGTLGGCPVAVGDRVVLDWRAANRDPEVFGGASGEEFAPGIHAAANVVYGTGVHACPGRVLATRELRVLVRALLAAGAPALAEGAAPAVREEAPLAGWRTLPVRFVSTR